MRLLFDQNLSPLLVTLLADLFTQSVHVRDVGLQAADDETVWNYAIQQRLVIISKDSDFRQRSFLFGGPPQSNLDQTRQLLNQRNRGEYSVAL